MGCHFLLPWIFLTQGSNLGLPHCTQDEALARYSVSSEIPRSVLKCEMVLFTLDVTPKVPRLEGVPGLPGAPQDEAGLTRKFETSHVGAAKC